MTDLVGGGFAASDRNSRHDVSILIGIDQDVGWQPGEKTSMIMRLPHRWQGSTCGAFGSNDHFRRQHVMPR
jgi:hypothetical protein